MLFRNVYDSKGVECELRVPGAAHLFACSSLSGGYSLVIGRGVME